MDILGSEWFPSTPAEREELYERHIVGTLHTNWNLLCLCARSNLSLGTVQASQFLGIWKQKLKSGEDDGATSFLLILNYGGHVVGPLLGCILSSGLAIESMVRLLAELAAERTSVSLAELEKGSFRDRVIATVAAAGAGELPADLMTRLDALVNFRNDCAHDSPLSFDSDRLGRRSHGKKRSYDKDARYAGFFPALVGDPMAITPAHALRAVEVHDGIMRHIMNEGAEELLEGVNGVATRALLPITDLWGTEMEDVRRIADAWDNEFTPWRESIPESVHEAAYRDFIRGTRIKPV